MAGPPGCSARRSQRRVRPPRRDRHRAVEAVQPGRYAVRGQPARRLLAQDDRGRRCRIGLQRGDRGAGDLCPRRRRGPAGPGSTMWWCLRPSAVVQARSMVDEVAMACPVVTTTCPIVPSAASTPTRQPPRGISSGDGEVAPEVDQEPSGQPLGEESGDRGRRHGPWRWHRGRGGHRVVWSAGWCGSSRVTCCQPATCADAAAAAACTGSARADAGPHRVDVGVVAAGHDRRTDGRVDQPTGEPGRAQRRPEVVGEHRGGEAPGCLRWPRGPPAGSPPSRDGSARRQGRARRGTTLRAAWPRRGSAGRSRRPGWWCRSPGTSPRWTRPRSRRQRPPRARRSRRS